MTTTLSKLICPDAQAIQVPADGTARIRAFDQVRYRLLRTQDVHQQADSIRNWSQEYDQISAGQFKGHLREVWSSAPRVQLFHEYTEQITFQSCLPWSGSVWFGFPDRRGHGALGFCGREMEASAPMLMSARKGSEFNLRTPQQFGIYGLLLDETELLERLDRWGVCFAGTSALQAVPLSIASHHALCDILESMIGLGEAGEVNQPLGQAMLGALLDDLLACLYAIPAGGSQLTQNRLTRDRLDVVMRARALALKSGHSPDEDELKLETLCSRLHITRRTLQNYCMSVVGKSPADFLKAVRLNACRRMLQDDPARQTVQDAAWRWGFRHMGHFSKDYKALFGELPSETLQAHTV